MASWEKCPLEGMDNKQSREDLKKMEDTGGEAVWDRRSVGGGRGTWDGVRTEAGGWLDQSHVCVQPPLFAASWMSMKH